jgi:glycosyltransferase involved in cell wall biosynthesis
MKKILWITNCPFSYHHVLLGKKELPRSSGTWLDAAYLGIISQPDIQLHIVTVSNISEPLKGEYEGHVFYILPGGDMSNYNVDSKVNSELWGNLAQEVEPDIVHVWGTESRYSYLAMKILAKYKTVIYMQGVINSIYENYYSGVPKRFVCSSIRDKVERMLLRDEYTKFRKQRSLEYEMIRMADVVIVENDWCEYQCKSISPNTAIFRNKLPIKEEFYEASWNDRDFERHTIFTNSGGYPIKGHHILFKAVSIVKKEYPDVKVYIPGRKLSIAPRGKDWLRQTSFEQYLNYLIKEHNLQDNIHYVGNLSSKEMASYLGKCNAYVMPSIIENHSSSLIEALVVGTPCISSFVGGVRDLVENNRNCLLYNSLDYQVLAGLIIKMFSTDDCARHLSDNTKLIRERKNESFAESILSCYRQLF